MPKFKTGMAALVVATSVLATFGSAQAALVSRGNGMIYDTTLNVTWLADMNYAATSGYAAANAGGSGSNIIASDGRMGWDAARNWANNLVHGGYDDWRLPTVNASDTSCSSSMDPGGGFPLIHHGFGCTGGELSHLFVVDLGNQAQQSVLDTTGDTDEQIANLALFSNVKSQAYWSGLELESASSNVWLFGTSRGMQTFDLKNIGLYALAVRSGDVAVPDSGNDVPEPGSLALALAALGAGALAGRHRRR